MVALTYFQPTLLDCWACRDLKRFRLSLKGGGGIAINEKGQTHNYSTSHPRSPGFSLGSAGGGGGGVNGACPPSEVNRRDHLGRTVLHLIATSTEPVSIDYLTALLAHPSVNVNLQDHENGWTPLHRALYHGNLLTALTLLKRSAPADIRVKDLEGLTPFDLYNSTVHGTNPTAPSEGEGGELFTWGANRNYTLGLGNSDDRALPDRVNIYRGDDEDGRKYSREPGSRFDRIKVKDIVMNKFATVVLTAEKSENVWVCGIGANGRIGRAPQTQINLEPLRDFTETATKVAVGPDHTCIVTSGGEVFSYGHNRFHQMGFTLENGQGIVSSSTSTKGSGGAASATFGVVATAIPNAELDVQITPRKVVGQLKREHVVGVGAGKLHSAAFTSDALYTWGTNTGQLGYDRAATPIQITPRRVTLVTSTQRIQSVAVTDFATACLLINGDVLLLHNDTSFFVRFPQPGFSSDMSVFRPRQARPKPSIHKLVSGPNNSFAAISDMGDLWQFSLEHPSEYAQSSGSNAKANVKPQLIWSVRKNKKVGAAKDVALGSGSDMILVTESGHVFVRSKKGGVSGGGGAESGNSQGSHSGKGKSGWRSIPFLQRVSKVATNESGALAAIKVDAKVREIKIRGRTLQEDLQELLPHLKAYSSTNTKKEEHDIVGNLADAAIPLRLKEEGDESDGDSEEDSDDESGNQRYITMALIIAESARRWTEQSKEKPENGHVPPFGCDMYFVAGNHYLPAHRAIVSARLPALACVLDGFTAKGGSSATTSSTTPGVVVRRLGPSLTLTLTGCSFGTMLFLLHYLYTDDLPPVWTASIGIAVQKIFSSVKLQPSLIHTQLKQLGASLNLPALLPSLHSPVPTSPRPSLSSDLETLFKTQVDTPMEQSPHHDVELIFEDKSIPAHSVLLRRSPFFAALFQPEWTSTRWTEGVIQIDMKHVRWEVARIVLLHLYTDGGSQLFIGSDADRSQDQYIDFIVEVLALSNEMLLTKLKLVCSTLLRKRILYSNVAALLSDADFYQAITLKEAVMDYISRTMENLLEAGVLDGLEHRMIKDLTRCVREKQDERMHRGARERYIDFLTIKHRDYFELLDLPPPSLGVVAAKVTRRPPRSSPIILPQDSSKNRTVTGRRSTPSSSSPVTSPALRPLSSVQMTPGGAGNDSSLMFSMDDEGDGEVGDWPSPSLTTSVPKTTNGRKRHVLTEEAENLTLPPAIVMRPQSTAPWKSRTVESEKATQSSAGTSPSAFDLRSIMAAEDRKKQILQSQGSSRTASPLPPGKTTPTRPANSSQASAMQQLSPLPALSTSSSSSSAIKMGPTYTPTRMPTKSPTPKRVTSSTMGEITNSPAVWSSSVKSPAPSLHAPTPTPPPLLSPAAGKLRSIPMASPANRSSFAQIQAEELQRQATVAPNSSRMSFAEIQKQDRLEDERRKEEEKSKAEFEKWFEEESKRVKREEQGKASTRGGKGKATPAAKKGRGGKGPKKSKEGGEGDRSVETA
ncbi:hypothetical protein CBS101457_000509 [Exobasidium rhododendri]|nr:hypothetical protein CBS101457_000509 [Exobasidium rhododendri]